MFGQEPGGVIAVGDAELAARTVAIGVDRGLGHPQFAGDLLGAEVPVDQTQALPLARSQQFDLLVHDAGPFGLPTTRQARACVHKAAASV